MVRDEKFLPGGAPGLDSRAIQWTLNRHPVLVAADAKSIEISNPHKESERFRRPGHLSWLNSGIYMMEDVDLEEWAADCELLVGDNADVISSDESCYVATLIIQNDSNSRLRWIDRRAHRSPLGRKSGGVMAYRFRWATTGIAVE